MALQPAQVKKKKKKEKEKKPITIARYGLFLQDGRMMRHVFKFKT
jgi:hypothetical protein